LPGDEIGELPLELQAKLLRVLENGEFERLGSSHTMEDDEGPAGLSVAREHPGAGTCP